MGKLFIDNFALDLNKKVLSDVDAIDNKVISQSIEAILMTNVGERLFEDFGSGLNLVPFERLDASSAESLLDNIIKTISRYEKRITIISDQCSINISKINHYVTLKIIYYKNLDGTSGEFNKKIIY